MSTPFFGRSIKRNEDPQLLTGQAQFVDDVELPGMLHAAFKRSDYAHAGIRSIDAEAARNLDGVVAVYIAQDLGDFWQPSPLLVPPPPVEDVVFHERTAGQLAKEKVRYVGEPVAMVVAESRYIAEDAAEQIFVDYEPLDPVMDLEKALDDNSALVHEDVGSNLGAHVIQRKGNYEQARADADVVVARRLHYDRGSSAPMETRGVVAQYDAKAGELTVWDSTQAPIAIRNGLAGMLGLSERQVRVIAPFVGGGFGPKIMMFYPEETLVPWAAMQLERPIKWIEDRREHFYATTQERLQIHDAEIALTRDGKILGVKDTFLHDSGAYIPYGLTVPLNSQCTLLGPYVIPNYASEFRAVFTNKTIVTPYRGAGRPHGVFVIERLLDLAARKLDIDPLELRRRNFIPPDEFPWNNEIIYQDFSELTYDSGNYEAVLDKTMDMIGWHDFRINELPRLREEGRLVGIGLVMYVEGTGIGPYEGSRVHVETSGKVTAVTGVGTQGQGHYTSFAQIVADALGVSVEDVAVTTGDSGQFHWGTGTFASRGAVVAGSAIHSAAKIVREKILHHAAAYLEAREEDIELADGFAHARGAPDAKVSLAELAVKANPLRGAVRPGTEPGLEATAYFGPEMGATANGAHAIIVEIDPQTFDVEIKRYVVVHDCGTMINPMIVEGQVHGGVAQGIGDVFYEQLIYDDSSGQLLNASFMDYLVPTSTTVPRIEVGHEETPSPFNPMGVKGAGEAGAIPSAAVFAQAIEDALTKWELEILEIPLSPNRLFELVKSAER